MHDFYIYGMLVIWSLFNFVDIYKSNTDYKHISQMFEIIVYIQQSVCFSFFSNSGTTCCSHCSSETKVPVILFNESPLLKCQEILSLRKGQGLSILYLSYQPKWIKVTIIIWSVIESSLLYPKFNEKSRIV